MCHSRRPSSRRRTVLDPRSKTCGRCRRERSLSHFNRAGDGLQHWCRDCFREYFRARGELHLRQVEESTRRRTAAACALVRARLIAEACVDCGEDEIAVLEFDHVRDKRGDLARMAHEGAELEEIEAELAKCEVVCASCHRRRTATRAGWARATGVPGRTGRQFGAATTRTCSRCSPGPDASTAVNAIQSSSSSITSDRRRRKSGSSLCPHPSSVSRRRSRSARCVAATATALSPTRAAAAPGATPRPGPRGG